MTDLLKQAYDAQEFRKMGYELVDKMSDYLQKSSSGADLPAIKYMKPEQALENWAIEPASAETPIDLFEKVLNNAVHLHHPGYMGHQISPPVPVAALAGLLGDFLNNGMGVYEMGIPGTAMERQVIRLVAQQMGFASEADGLLTSGGTLANLTALLAARSIKSPGNVWQDGPQEKLAVMVSEEAHYCIDRAVRIMGWGEAGIIKIPVDGEYRMRTELLPTYHEQALAAGVKVIAVVGSACSTATGAFDDLQAIGTFCQEYNLWMHVDGAHGGALVFSKAYRHIVKGIEMADTVAMDFHKMLLTPAITTALVFKNGQHSFQTFHQKAEYLFSEKLDQEWYNLARRTFECTKGFMSIKVVSIVQTYGLQLWDDYITQVCQLGTLLGELVENRPDFELATIPQCNIVCFRVTPKHIHMDQYDDLNANIRQKMLEDGQYYLVQTKLNGTHWLRTTLSNPFTSKNDLEAMLDKVAAFANASI